RSGSFRPSATTGSSFGISGGTFIGGVGSAPQFGGVPGFLTGGTTGYDPVVSMTLSAEHNTSLSSQNLAAFGGAASGAVQIITSKPNTGIANFSYTQAFETGTNVQFALNNNRITNQF